MNEKGERCGGDKKGEDPGDGGARGDGSLFPFRSRLSQEIRRRRRRRRRGHKDDGGHLRARGGPAGAAEGGDDGPERARGGRRRRERDLKLRRRRSGHRAGGAAREGHGVCLRGAGVEARTRDDDEKRQGGAVRV